MFNINHFLNRLQLIKMDDDYIDYHRGGGFIFDDPDEDDVEMDGISLIIILFANVLELNM